jgi:hypothetical protein
MQRLGRAVVRNSIHVWMFNTVVNLLLAACGFSSTPYAPARSAIDTPIAYTPFPGETPLSTLTPTIESPIFGPAQSAPEDCTNDSEFAADLGVLDGTLIRPGDDFTKTWRMRNSGTCAWNREYTWEQIDAAGNRLLALEPVTPLDGEVPPGGTVDVSIVLVLDENAELGRAQVARFQLRSPAGEYFGSNLDAQVYAVNGSGRCPPETDDLRIYIHLQDRYCFLYLQTGEASLRQDGALRVGLPVSQGSTEEPLPAVGIYNMGSTGGLDLDAWAGQQIKAAQDPTHPADVERIRLGAVTAYATGDLPGPSPALHVYLMQDGVGFEIVVMPIEGGRATETLELWENIRTSFTFYAP